MNYKDYLNRVGLNVSTMFTNLVSAQYGRTRVSTNAHRKKIEMVVIHTTGNNASARNEALNIRNNSGINSFNAVVDAVGVYETVRFTDVSHHAGNKHINQTSIGVELCEVDIDKGYQNLVKYLGWVFYQLNLPVNLTTLKLHSEFVPTSCGAYYKKKGMSTIIADITKWKNVASSKPISKKVGKYANFGGKVRLFHKAVGDECYHMYANKNGKKNVYENVKPTSALILDEENGRVLVDVPRFKPSKVWIANKEISVSSKPKNKL